MIFRFHVIQPNVFIAGLVGHVSEVFSIGGERKISVAPFGSRHLDLFAHFRVRGYDEDLAVILDGHGLTVRGRSHPASFAV